MIHTEEDLAAPPRGAGRLDPALAPLRAAMRPLAPRRRPPGFAGLCAIVIGQQVSTASAAAIWTRFAAALIPPTPAADPGRAPRRTARLGLSAQDPDRQGHRGGHRERAFARRLAAMPADEAHAALTALHGIGPWTADIYLLFCLGHADAWPAGRPRPAGGGAARLRPEEAADRQGHGRWRSAGGRGAVSAATAVGLLSRGQGREWLARRQTLGSVIRQPPRHRSRAAGEDHGG